MMKTSVRRKDKPSQSTGDETAQSVRGTSQAAEDSLKLQDRNDRNVWLDAWRYQLDRWQRSVLFFDTLRQCADGMLAHERAGLPPLLGFPYELVLDAREFPRPANYALLRIKPDGDKCFERCVKDDARPMIVFDPRAGHGPGIGGFKRDSEVGIAMHEGYPVYFVMFFPEPCDGQTLADVHHALRRFVAEVAGRHPGPPPVLYGNCQAGWAVTLLSADCVGMAGPAILNGSPLSYWAGAAGVNPMRLAGGLSGGSWIAHLMADLGNGRFDGAWLVQNFETLNPGHALWGKYYDLFAHVDDDAERFREFERWWSGFYFLSRAEILAIVENLFIGNRLEQGLMRICECCVADLKRIQNPLLIFASSGDNITPPHQALSWIPAVYGSTEELKAAGQRIVYLLNPHVGHLGIFVSAAIARREHRAILENVDVLEDLAPGLYEMRIASDTGDEDCKKPQYHCTFEPRRVEDIRYEYPAAAFETVRDLSGGLEYLYAQVVSRWIRSWVTPASAAAFVRLHPERLKRYMFATELNPWAHISTVLAQFVKAFRHSADTDNKFVTFEHEAASAISRVWQNYRESRDSLYEAAFSALYNRGMTEGVDRHA